MENLKKEISAYVEQGLKKKEYFNGTNLSDIELNRAVDNIATDFEYETIYKTELRALQSLFNNIFEDFYARTISERIWKIVYAFPQNNDKNTETERIQNPFEIKSDTPVAINYNIKTVRKFMESLLNKAVGVFNSTKDEEFISKYISKESRIFLIGDVGIGKSTFLKYIASTFSKTIVDIYKCFWIQVDFTKDEYRSLTISEAIKYVSTQHFRRKYFDSLDENERKRFKDFLRTYFINSEKNNEEIEKEFKSCYITFATVFEEQKTKQYDNRIQTGVSDYIEEYYPTVYVLDGLDDIHSKPTYHRLLKDIYDIISDNERKGTFIFVMRNESHKALLDEYSQPSSKIDGAKLYSYSTVFTIEPAKLNTIISKRLDLMIELMDDLVYKNKLVILERRVEDSDKETEAKINEVILKLKNYFHNKNNLEAYFNLLLIYLHNGIQFGTDINFDDWNRSKSITELKNLIGNNFRKLMGAINVVHIPFLENLQMLEKPFDEIINVNNLIYKEGNKFIHREKSDYNLRMYNQIVAKDYKVIPTLLQKGTKYSHPYHYVYDNLKETLVRLDSNVHSSFIYNVFFPVNIEKQPDKSYNILLKIRILQLFYHYDKKHKQAKIHENDIILYLLRNFPYAKDRIIYALNELLDMHLLTNEYSHTGYNLTITRVGINHIENLIYNFGYIRIILDDMLFPQKVYEYFNDKDPKVKDKSKWILKQIPRVAMFLLLIKYVEEWEIKNRKVSFRDIEWNISDKMKYSIVDVITRICIAHDPFLVKLKQYFKNYFNKI